MDFTLSLGFHAPPWLMMALLATLIGVGRAVFRSRHQLQDRHTQSLLTLAVPRNSDQDQTTPQRIGKDSKTTIL